MPQNQPALAIAFNKKISTELSTKYLDPLTKTSMSLIERTPEQRSIIDLAQDPSSSSIMCEAVAGSGKSFTLLDIMFSTPFAWSTATSNSVGHRAWANKIGKRPNQLRLVPNKIFGLCKKLATSDNLPYQLFGDTMKLVTIAKNDGIVPTTQKIPRARYTPIEDTPENWLLRAQFHDFFPDLEVVEWARKILALSIHEAFQGTIDYSDQLYMTACFGTSALQKYPLLLVDEFQDFSMMQFIIIRHMLAPGGRLIAAGDRHQAIYGFRGALSDSIPRAIDEFNMTPLGLTVSFRCSNAVVAEAQPFNPNITHWEGANSGTIIRNSNREFPIQNLDSFILCRNTAPLIQMAIRCLGASIGATVAGRDIGKSLINLIEKIAGKKNNLSSTSFEPRLDDWAASQIQNNPKSAESVSDKALALQKIFETVSNTDGAKNLLNTLYSDENSTIKFSTIHRAKGLEAPNVMILDPFLMPSKYATQSWQLSQEDNLQYVAITRAQNNLTYINSSDII